MGVIGILVLMHITIDCIGEFINLMTEDKDIVNRTNLEDKDGNTVVDTFYHEGGLRTLVMKDGRRIEQRRVLPWLWRNSRGGFALTKLLAVFAAAASALGLAGLGARLTSPPAVETPEEADGTSRLARTTAAADYADLVDAVNNWRPYDELRGRSPG